MNSHNDRYRSLIEKVKLAFSDVPYPGDENIVSTPEHIEICEECRDLFDAFVGHGKSFFKAAGWH